LRSWGRAHAHPGAGRQTCNTPRAGHGAARAARPCAACSPRAPGSPPGAGAARRSRSLPSAAGPGRQRVAPARPAGRGEQAAPAHGPGARACERGARDHAGRVDEQRRRRLPARAVRPAPRRPRRPPGRVPRRARPRPVGPLHESLPPAHKGRGRERGHERRVRHQRAPQAQRRRPLVQARQQARAAGPGARRVRRQRAQRVQLHQAQCVERRRRRVPAPSRRGVSPAGFGQRARQQGRARRAPALVHVEVRRQQQLPRGDLRRRLLASDRRSWQPASRVSTCSCVRLQQRRPLCHARAGEGPPRSPRSAVASRQPPQPPPPGTRPRRWPSPGGPSTAGSAAGPTQWTSCLHSRPRMPWPRAHACTHARAR